MQNEASELVVEIHREKGTIVAGVTLRESRELVVGNTEAAFLLLLFSFLFLLLSLSLERMASIQYYMYSSQPNIYFPILKGPVCIFDVPTTFVCPSVCWYRMENRERSSSSSTATFSSSFLAFFSCVSFLCDSDVKKKKRERKEESSSWTNVFLHQVDSEWNVFLSFFFLLSRRLFSDFNPLNLSPAFSCWRNPTLPIPCAMVSFDSFLYYIYKQHLFSSSSWAFLLTTDRRGRELRLK